MMTFALLFQCVSAEAADGAALTGDSLIPLSSPENAYIVQIDEQDTEDELYENIKNEELEYDNEANKIMEENTDYEEKNGGSLNLLSYAANDKDGKEVFAEDNNVYACGIPIVIKEEGGKTYIYDGTGTKKLIETEITKEAIIYGGGKNVSVNSSQITLKSGTVSEIIGGGRNGSVINDTKIILEGGSVTNIVCGGGRNNGADSSNTYITAGNASVKWLYGGGFRGDVSGNTNIEIKSGNYTYVCGGGYYGNVGGNTLLDVKNSAIDDTVFAGGWRGRVEGSTKLTFENSTAQYICGGGYITVQNENSDSTVGMDTEVSIISGEVTEKVYGGGWSSDVKGNTVVNIQNGSIENLYAGGYEGKTEKNAEINMYGGTVNKTIFGGGQKESASVGNSLCTLSGGSTGFLYGGGWKGNIEGNTEVMLIGGNIENIAFGGGYSVDASVRNTNITVDGSEAKIVYGGGENAPVLENTLVTVKNGSISSVYGGGRYEGSNVSGTSQTIVEGGTVDFLYGGGNDSNVASAYIKLLGGTMQSVYGGGALGICSNTNVEINGGTLGWFYGGGKNGVVSETSNVTVNSGSVLNSLYGGGRNESAEVGSVNVNVRGGEIKNLFGGGDKAGVTGEINLSVDTENKINFIGGGGYSGTSNIVKTELLKGEISTLYAGGYTGTALQTRVDISDGDISQLIAGNGTGGNSLESRAYIKGGIIRELYLGYSDDLKIYYSGGSILLNRSGIILDEQGNILYKARIIVGETPLVNKNIKCSFDGGDLWPSKTDNSGALTVYLPLAEKSVNALDENNDEYAGSVMADSKGNASVTLSKKQDGEQYYTVSFTAGEGGKVLALADGSIITDGENLKKGSNVIFTAAANDNYHIKEWIIDGKGFTAESETYTIESLSSSVTIEAVFEKDIVNTEELNSLINSCDELTNSIYVSINGSDIETENKWVTRDVMKTFQEAIAEAKAVLNNSDIFQSDADNAVMDLESAKGAFEEQIKYGIKSKSVDKKKLNNLITTAQNSLAGVYVSIDGSDINKNQKWVSQDIMDKFLFAIEEAESVAEDQTVQQSIADDMAVKLESEINAFISAQKYGEKDDENVPVNTEELSSLIDSCNELKNGVYVSIDGNDIEADNKWVTRDVMKTFQEAISMAKALLDNTNISQNEADDAKSALEGAKTAFESSIKYGNKKNNADKKELNNLITSAQSSLSNVYVSVDGSDIEKNQKWVSQSIMNKFLLAIEEAENVAENLAAQQSEVDASAVKLKNEINTFVSAQKYGEKKKKIRVEFSSGKNGGIKGFSGENAIESPYMAELGEKISFTAEPDEGYKVDYWTENGYTVDNKSDIYKTENTYKNLSVCVYFSKIDDMGQDDKLYFIKVSDDIKNGIISVLPMGSVKPGTAVSVTILPDEDYYLVKDSLKYNGIVIKDNSFIMPEENVIITADFAFEENKYVLSVEAGTGGTVTGGGEFKEREKVDIKAVPDSQYHFVKWETQYEKNISDINSSTAYVTMPSNNMTVKALFEKTNSSSSSSSTSGSSGGGGGGGGGSSSQSNSPKTKASYLEEKDGNASASLKITVKPDSSGNCIVRLSDDDISDVLNKAKNADSPKNINLNISVMPDKSVNVSANNFYIVLPKKTADFTAMKNAGELYLSCPNVSLSIDKVALEKLLSQNAGSIQFSIEKMVNLSNEAAKMIDGRPAFEFSAILNQKRITDFGDGKIKISIPYEIREGENPDFIKGYRVDKDGTPSIWENSFYNKDKKTLEIITSSLAGFGIMLNLPESMQNNEEIKTSKSQFDDISGHWAEDDIVKMAEMSIVSGMTENKFMPNEYMTRGMLTTIIGRAANVDTNKYTSCEFSDVSDEAYYMPYAAWAAENNIVSGTGGGKFSPDSNLTREEAAAILYRYLIFTGKDIKGGVEKEELFDDDSSISSWAKEAVYGLRFSGIISGRNGNIFAPRDNVTRAEVTLLICRALFE